jgi:hypothetical protein
MKIAMPSSCVHRGQAPRMTMPPYASFLVKARSSALVAQAGLSPA